MSCLWHQCHDALTSHSLLAIYISVDSVAELWIWGKWQTDTSPLFQLWCAYLNDMHLHQVYHQNQDKIYDVHICVHKSLTLKFGICLLLSPVCFFSLLLTCSVHTVCKYAVMQQCTLVNLANMTLFQPIETNKTMWVKSPRIYHRFI